MRNILLLFMVAFGCSLNAQITIDQDDMPNSGDTIRYSSSIDLGGINYEETGTNYSWDFSSLIPLTQAVDTFSSVSETPLVYQVAFFLYSNLAKPLSSFDYIPGFQVTDPYEFYKKSNSEFKMVGFGVTMNGIPIPNKFQDSDVIYQFPVNYGNLDSSYSSYEFDIPAVGYLGGWKKRVNYCDGWGTLNTPFGSFQTIRIKSEIIQFDSVYIDSLGMGLPLSRNYVEYKWLGNDFGLPLCKITDDGLLPQIEYLDSVRSLFVDVPELNETVKRISVFPNPAGDYLNIKSNYRLEYAILFDYKGNLLKTKYSNDYLMTMNTSGIKPGMYILAIKTENHLKYEKVIIE